MIATVGWQLGCIVIFDAVQGPAYSIHHRSTSFMNSMKKLSEDMIQEVKSLEYPAAGVSAVSLCRPEPKQQPRLDAWW